MALHVVMYVKYQTLPTGFAKLLSIYEKLSFYARVCAHWNLIVFYNFLKSHFIHYLHCHDRVD